MEIPKINFEELRFDNIGNWPIFPKRIVIGIVSLLTFSLGYVIDLSEKIDNVDSSTKRVITLSGLFIDTHRQVSNIDSVRDEVNRIQDQLTKLTSLLPSSSESARVLEDISQKATESDVQFVSIKPGKEENKGFYQESSTEFRLLGTYNALGGFVSSISSMNRIITLHDFAISVGKNRRSLTMDVLSKTYWAVPLGKGK